MLTLRTIHAHEGDCLVLIHGNSDRFILIDGGPANTFGPHLQKVLTGLVPARLDAVCLSHVDTDHTTGLKELFAELRDLQDDGDPALVAIDDFWINEFGTTIDGDGGGRSVRLANVLAAVAAANAANAMQLAGAAVNGIKHGHELVVLAKQLKLSINKQTNGKPWLAGKTKSFDVGDLKITVIGPTEGNLHALRDEWDEWLEKQEKRVNAGKLGLAAMADQSIPNLSSIQLLVECAEKRLLLTGDGRGDHLLEALEEQDLLDDDGNIDVDVLKMPHHGSDRNVNQAFFKRVRAKTYVVSADGKHGNPDRATLDWIHKAAKQQGRTYELVLTNLPPDAAEFTAQNPPGAIYSLAVRDPNDDYIDVVIVP
jgi:hypothetical protein